MAINEFPNDAYAEGYRFGRFEEVNPTGNIPDIPEPYAYRTTIGWAFLAEADDWEAGYVAGIGDRPKFPTT